MNKFLREVAKTSTRPHLHNTGHFEAAVAIFEKFTAKFHINEVLDHYPYTTF